MNKVRRAQLAKIDHRLCQIKSDIKDVLWDERDCLRSIPENFEGTDRYNQIEQAVDELEDAADAVDVAIHHLHEAMQ